MAGDYDRYIKGVGNKEKEEVKVSSDHDTRVSKEAPTYTGKKVLYR